MTEFFEALVPVTAEDYYHDEKIGRYGRRPYLVENWCRENGIRAARYSVRTDYDVWSVPDEQHRVLFALRWS